MTPYHHYQRQRKLIFDNDDMLSLLHVEKAILLQG